MTTKKIPHYIIYDRKTGESKVYKHFAFLCKDNGLDKESTVRYQVNKNGMYQDENFTVEPTNLISQSWGATDNPHLVGNKL